MRQVQEPGLVEAATAVARRGSRRANLVTRGEPRNRQVQVKLSESELEELKARAAKAGVTVPALLMRSTLTGGLEAAAEYEALRADMKLALRLMAAVSNNLNQLARQANAAGGGVEGVPDVTYAQLTAALETLDRASLGVSGVASAVVRPLAPRYRNAS